MRLALSYLALLACLAAVVAGCGEPLPADTETTAGAADCTPDGMETVAKGTLTVGTDKPAYPPYFEDDDPENGKGFESAVVYAIAEDLGYTADQVKWTVVPFNASYAPGPKDFDFDVNQISITPKRAKQVDFSSPYYTANQAVVVAKNSPAASAKTLADLADTKIGVQIGTTSLDAANTEIHPTSEVQVFDNSNDVVAALKQGSVDAVVVDVPTAFYLTATQVPEAEIIGQFPAPGGDQWGALLQKGSPLTSCVSQAVEDLDRSGELKKITDRWMSQAAGAPQLPPS